MRKTALYNLKSLMNINKNSLFRYSTKLFATDTKEFTNITYNKIIQNSFSNIASINKTTKYYNSSKVQNEAMYNFLKRYKIHNIEKNSFSKNCKFNYCCFYIKDSQVKYFCTENNKNDNNKDSNDKREELVKTYKNFDKYLKKLFEREFGNYDNIYYILYTVLILLFLKMIVYNIKEELNQVLRINHPYFYTEHYCKHIKPKNPNIIYNEDNILLLILYLLLGFPIEYFVCERFVIAMKYLRNAGILM